MKPVTQEIEEAEVLELTDDSSVEETVVDPDEQLLLTVTERGMASEQTCLHTEFKTEQEWALETFRLVRETVAVWWALFWSKTTIESC